MTREDASGRDRLGLQEILGGGRGGRRQAVSEPWGAKGKGSDHGDPLNLLFPLGAHIWLSQCAGMSEGSEKQGCGTAPT